MKTETQSNPHDNIQKLGSLIKDIKIAMFTSIDAERRLHSCPMATQEVEFDGSLWFFASKASGKVANIRNEPHVNLIYSSPKDQHYISVSGRAELVEDLKKAQELWSPTYKMWFEKELNDPDLILIKVNVEDAEYWDSSRSTWVVLAGFAKSFFGSKTPPAQNGDHQKIHLQ